MSFWAKRRERFGKITALAETPPLRTRLVVATIVGATFFFALLGLGIALGVDDWGGVLFFGAIVGSAAATYAMMLVPLGRSIAFGIIGGVITAIDITIAGLSAAAAAFTLLF